MITFVVVLYQRIRLDEASFLLFFEAPPKVKSPLRLIKTLYHI